MEITLAGHYQIVRYLSCGGFSNTYIARDCHLPGKPLCVVKQFQPKVRDTAMLKTAKQLFDREAEVLYQLGNHDRIPRLLAHFEQGKNFYLVQEFIEGQPLDKELTSGKKLVEIEAIALIHSILQVLEFVHNKQIIHRDIKPANLIRRSYDNEIVLIDFGAVKEVAIHSGKLGGKTGMTVAIGSPGYMPSEQQAFKPQFSSDIYAVGMIGIQAISGLNPLQFSQKACQKEALFENADISLDLATVLERMVRSDYRQRYKNATAALFALQPLVKSLPKSSTTSSYPHYQLSAVKLADQSQVSTPLVRSSYKLPSGLSHQLQKFLVDEIGPIASIMIKRATGNAVNEQDFVENLLVHLPTTKTSQFRQQIYNILHPQSRFQPISYPVEVPTLLNLPTQVVEPDFVKACEQELAKFIGPISLLIVRQTLAGEPNLSKTQLIENLVKHLPNSQLHGAFRQSVEIYL
jgi:serine/threonine protein kinase